MWPISNAPAATAEKEQAVAADVEDKEVLDENQGSIIMGIISQLRKGSDLSKVTLPTFVLEPRSMLERMTDFMAHPDFIFDAAKETVPLQRFIKVVRYYLSGFHIRPQGVKKPYNPVLGEIFRCRWDLPDKTKAFYVCEQVMHHPPMSAFYYASPDNKVRISGVFKPKSKFLGNSAATIMEGGNEIEFSHLPGEVYFLSNPNIYARGILFGTMYMELGDNATIRCPKNDLVCELEFKVKGFFTGTYNGIGGKIKKESTGEILYTISGKWSDIIYIQKTGSPTKDILFDADGSKIVQKQIAPETEQEEYESRRLWAQVTAGIKGRNMDLATDSKTKIEQNQRALVKERAEKGIEWQSRFFNKDANENFYFSTSIPMENPEEANKILNDTIFGKASNPLHAKFWK